MGFIPHEDSQNDVSDAEVDELMEKFGMNDSDGPSISKDDDSVTEQTTEQETTPTVEQTPPVAQAAPVKTPVEQAKEQEFEYNYKGRMIREPLSMILKRASQGYDYSQQMASINQKAESIGQLESQYKPIDEWVRANPDKWEKLQSVIKAEQQGYGDLPADHPILQKLSQFESVIEEIKQEKIAAKEAKEDQELNAEIKSIQEKYKDLDWKSVDANGRDRAQSVLAHAVEHGFRTFKTAFLDLYHEDLLRSAETRAREQFAAQKEKQSKTGLLTAKQLAPTVGKNLTQPKKNTKSYPGTNEILQELGIQ